MAQYVYDTYGKFPATIPSILAAGYVQAQHIDTEFYDTHFQPGAYLPTHVTEKSPAQPSDELAITRSFPMQLKRRGVELRLIVGDHNRLAATVDLPLLKAVARAHCVPRLL